MKKYLKKIRISSKALVFTGIFILSSVSFAGCKKSEQIKETITTVSKQIQKDSAQQEKSQDSTSLEENTSLEEITSEEITTSEQSETTLAEQVSSEAPAQQAPETEPPTAPTFYVTDMLMTCYAVQDINVRKGPSTNYDRIGSLSANQEVIVTGQADTGWYRISYNGGEAYASSRYLTSEQPISEQPSNAEASTSENTPSEEITNPPVFDTPPARPSNSKAEKREQAKVIAQEIANAILSDSELQTDIEKVGAAAYIVSLYCQQAMYTTEGENYSEAYGVFISGEFSCAGATRALGMVLSCMGYEWEHVNENQWTHQWCRLAIDGQIGWADGQLGGAGYGKHFVED